MRLHLFRAVVSALLLVAGFPLVSAAQGIGIGPRLSFVRGDVPTGTPSTRFWGGMIRLPLSRRLAVEGALDSRVETHDTGLVRVKERPLQGSLLVFPVRSRLSPYVLGGYGIYSRTVEVLDSDALLLPATAESERRSGLHFGFGAELFLGRRAAFVLDYRYRFVRFGQAGDGEEPVGLPFLKDHLSHEGSMWTTGVAFYF
jgi:hypothetical protein